MKKKTVYIPVENNNDLEIEINNVYNKTGSLSTVGVAERAFSLGVGQFESQELYRFTEEELNKYTKSVIKKALDIAAEKATVTPIDHEEISEGSFRPIWGVDDESITNSFEEVYKNFKV